MTIGAGKRRELITFQRATVVQDAYGEEVPTWADIPNGSRLANVRFGTSAERREAAAEAASQVTTFRVLADSLAESITITDRIRWDGLDWDITGIARIRPMAGAAEIELTAVASRD